MTTANFKKGDRVRRTGCSDLSYGLANGNEYVVEGATSTDAIRLEGVKGMWYQTNFELVEAAPIPEPTDEELANEFRKNYLRQHEIKRLMSARGFTPQYQKPNNPIWRDSPYQAEPYDLRFHRVVTPDPIITIV